MPADVPAPVGVFISYSHKDDRLRERLETNLSLLKRQGVIDAWHDRCITAGREWAGVIDEHLDRAALILLLVSADFLASDYCYDREMTRALERHDAGEARVIPIILRPVDWHNAPFARLQTLPKDGKAVTDWPSRDRAFKNITEGIRRAVAEILSSDPAHQVQQEPRFPADVVRPSQQNAWQALVAQAKPYEDLKLTLCEPLTRGAVYQDEHASRLESFPVGAQVYIQLTIGKEWSTRLASGVFLSLFAEDSLNSHCLCPSRSPFAPPHRLESCIVRVPTAAPEKFLIITPPIGTQTILALVTQWPLPPALRKEVELDHGSTTLSQVAEWVNSQRETSWLLLKRDYEVTTGDLGT